MMLQLLRRFWINAHVLLIPVFFIVHNYFLYKDVVKFSIIIKLFSVWLLLPFTLLTLLYFFYHKRLSMAAAFTSILLFLLFFYGPVTTFLSSIPVVRVLAKFSVVTCLLIVLVWLLFTVRKRNLNCTRFNSYLTLLFFILICFDTGQLIIKETGSHQPTNLFEEEHLSSINFPTLPADSLPDIYYFIFDEHNSSEASQQLFGKTNLVDSFLLHEGFYVSKKAVSAYTSTPVSVASAFCMSSFTLNINSIGMNEYLHAFKKAEMNPVVPALMKMGYRVKPVCDYRLYPGDTSEKEYVLFSNKEQVVLNQMFPYKYSMQLQLVLEDKFRNSKWIKNQSIKSNEKSRAYLLKTISRINEEIENNGSPKFVYAHLPLPHPPAFFSSTGQPLLPNQSQVLNRPEQHSEAYKMNLDFSKLLIELLVSKIKKSSSRNFVIVIAGDHGYRGNRYFKVEQKLKHAILFAVYFSDGDYKLANDSLYTPNTFRLIFKKYFDSSIQLLPPVIKFHDTGFYD